MRKISVTLGVALSVSLIVLSLALPVNHSITPLNHGNANLIADGSPLPPVPPPPPPGSNSIGLDGSPLPPVPPPPPQKLSHGTDALLPASVQG